MIHYAIIIVERRDMMEKQKKMYYYYDAHPENGLGSMIIKDELYLVGKHENYSHAIVTNHDFTTNTDMEDEYYIEIYQWWGIDGIYCHDVRLGTYIMSYDYNLIRNMWVDALKRKKENTEETLKKINEMMERI